MPDLPAPASCRSPGRREYPAGIRMARSRLPARRRNRTDCRRSCRRRDRPRSSAPSPSRERRSGYVFPEMVTELKIEVDLVADMTVYNPFDFFVEPEAETRPFEYPPEIRDDLAIYMKPEPAGPAFAEFMASIDRLPVNTVDFVVALNSRVQRAVAYTVRPEPGIQTPDETLIRAIGSCRDTSWLLVEILRNLGFAARFVSGYLIQLKPDIVSLDGAPGTDRDFTDLHAWCEVYIC